MASDTGADSIIERVTPDEDREREKTLSVVERAILESVFGHHPPPSNAQIPSSKAVTDNKHSWQRTCEQSPVAAVTVCDTRRHCNL